MTSPRPWQPLRLDDPFLPDLPAATAVTVAVVAFPRARAEDWAARATLALARGWGLEGRRSFVCDLALEDPELHRAAGVANDEGVTDLILYGASPRRVGHAVDDSVFLAPSGTVAPDPAGVRASPRWDTLVDGFAGADVLLLLYVPSDAPGADAAVARADAVVALADRDERVDVGDGADRLVAVLGPGPDEAGTVPPPEVRMEPPPRRDEPDEAPAPAVAAEPAMAGIATGDDLAGADEPAGRRASPVVGEERAGSRGRGFGRWLLIVLALAALVMVLAAALGWIDIPGMPGGDEVSAPAESVQAGESEAEPPTTTDPGPAPAGPEAAPGGEEADAPGAGEPGVAGGAETPSDAVVTAPVQAFAVQLYSYRLPDEAETRLAQLTAARPAHHFWITMGDAEGALWYRIFVGPAESRTEAEALRDEIAPGTGDWVIRPADRAFLLDQTDDPAAARARVNELWALGVPAHVLRASRADGSSTYRVYAGSFGSEAEAEPLRRAIRDAGLEPGPLTSRRGVPPA